MTICVITSLCLYTHTNTSRVASSAMAPPKGGQTSSAEKNVTSSAPLSPDHTEEQSEDHTNTAATRAKQTKKSVFLTSLKRSFFLIILFDLSPQ